MFLLYTLRDNVRVASSLLHSGNWAAVFSDECVTTHAPTPRPSRE